MPTPPRNPYIAGKALGDSHGFFGREDVFRLVQTTLSSPDQNSVVLFGQRRIGKTSILLNLRSRLSSSSFVPVYFDLMDRARKSLAQVSFELAATIAQELHLPQPARADFDDEGHGFRDKFLPTVYTALGNSRLVLLFDEFDVLNVGAEEKLASTSAALAFFPYLRDLMINEPRLGFVFVVGRKAEELGIEFKSAFKVSRFARVSVLDDESARSLVRTAERVNLLHFTDDAVVRLLELTARHPFFTQLTCQLLFERAYSNEPPSVEITSADLDAIVPKVLEAGESIFDWIWDGLPPAERVIFSAIASGTDEQTVITEERLVSTLQTKGIRILIRELELAPKTLVEWEMLKQIEGGYKFFVELMRLWVVNNKPLDKVKDELDRILPLADTLYRGANGFYRRGDLESAITQLQSALNVNPNHLKARLLLGEVYRAQGKFDDAVRELEEAYKIDEDGARVTLETALMQRAGGEERENLTEAALQDYARALAVSPNNVAAKERRTAIWTARGEAALQIDDLENARKAFAEANATHRLNEIDALERKREFEELAGTAEGLVRQEKWEEAVATYQQLVELDNEDTRWQEGLARVQQEWQIERRYAEGLGAMQQHKWSEAQRSFADVIHIRLNYKDAVGNLAFVTRKLRAALVSSQIINLVQSRKIKKTASTKKRNVVRRQARKSSKLSVRVLKNNSATVSSVVFSPNGKFLALGGHDREITVLDTRTYKVRHKLKAKSSVKSVDFSSDTSFLAGVDQSGSVQLWQVEDGLSIPESGVHRVAQNCVVFIPNTHRFVTGGYNYTIRVWTWNSESFRITSAIEGHYDSVRCIAISSDGTLLASGSADKTVRLWALRDGYERQRFSYASSIVDVAFSPTCKVLAICSGNRNVELRDIDHGNIEYKLKHRSPVVSLAFNTAGNLLACGSKDGTIQLWNPNDGKLLRTLTGHTDKINCISFSPDGKTLVSGSMDKSTRIWTFPHEK